MFLVHENPAIYKAMIETPPSHCERYEFYDVILQLFSDNQTFLQQFNSLYHAFKQKSQGASLSPATLTVILREKHDFGKFPILINSEGFQWEITSGQHIPSVVEYLLLEQLLAKVESHYLFHGASLVHHHTGYGICGASGAGKSTLAMALAEQGDRLFSDEMIALEASSGLMTPFPRKISLRPDSLQLIKDSINASEEFLYPFSGVGTPEEPLIPTIVEPEEKIHLKAIFFIESPAEEADSSFPLTIQVGVNSALAEMIEAFSREPAISVAHIAKLEGNQAGVLTVRIQEHGKKRFTDLCRQFSANVSYRVHAAFERPDHHREPRIIPLSRRDGTLKMLQFLRSGVRADYPLNEKNQDLQINYLMSVMSLINSVSFYVLQSGNLQRQVTLLSKILE